MQPKVVPRTLLAEFSFPPRPGSVGNARNTLDRTANDVVPGPTGESVEEHGCQSKRLRRCGIRAVAPPFRIPNSPLTKSSLDEVGMV